MKLRYSSIVSFGEHHKVFIVPLFLAILFLGALFVLTSRNASIATLTLELDGQRRTFQGQVVSGMTVQDALRASMLAGGLSFVTHEDWGGPFLTVFLDGRERRVSGRVAVSVNGRSVDEDHIDQIPLKPRDEVTVRIPLAGE